MSFPLVNGWSMDLEVLGRHSLHQLHHHYRVSGEGLDVLLVAKNQVDPNVVSPKTRVG